MTGGWVGRDADGDRGSGAGETEVVWVPARGLSEPLAGSPRVAWPGKLLPGQPGDRRAEGPCGSLSQAGAASLGRQVWVAGAGELLRGWSPRLPGSVPPDPLVPGKGPGSLCSGGRTVASARAQGRFCLRHDFLCLGAEPGTTIRFPGWETKLAAPPITREAASCGLLRPASGPNESRSEGCRVGKLATAV